MTTKQVEAIIQMRKKGTEYRAIAGLVGVSTSTVLVVLREAGMVNRRLHEQVKAKIAMLLHDWNAGGKSDVLARKYKYASVGSMYVAMSYYRSIGYDFYRGNRRQRAGGGR